MAPPRVFPETLMERDRYRVFFFTEFRIPKILSTLFARGRHSFRWFFFAFVAFFVCLATWCSFFFVSTRFNATRMKKWSRRRSMDNNYPHQPPLIYGLFLLHHHHFLLLLSAGPPRSSLAFKRVCLGGTLIDSIFAHFKEFLRVFFVVVYSRVVLVVCFVF